MRRDTVFRIASLTKPVVAAAAMMLVDDGVLALDQPVDELLPELAAPRVLRTIDGPLDDTVAGRTARSPSRTCSPTGWVTASWSSRPSTRRSRSVNAAKDQDLVMAEPDPRTPHAPDEWIKRFGALPLMYQPGERWQYNTSGLVLGVLVARAAGEPLPDVLAGAVFTPLGMTDTAFWLPAERLANLPKQYMTNFATGVMEEQTITEHADLDHAAGVPLRLGRAAVHRRRLLRVRPVHAYRRRRRPARRLLSEASLTAMTTNHLTDDQIAGGGMILGGRGWGFGQSVAVAPDECRRLRAGTAGRAATARRGSTTRPPASPRSC